MAHSVAGWAPRLLSRLVVRLCAIRPIQPLVTPIFYDALASHFSADAGWHFMNYGFDSERCREFPLPLRAEDDPDRLSIQLYDHVLSAVPVEGMHVLEVGCGRGGGAAYVQRYRRPARTIGVDLSYKTIRISRANHGDRHLHFLNADAAHLPFEDQTFDLVVNIESSHAYPSMAAFLGEAIRVLRPGGFLAFADLRWTLSPDHSGTSSGLDLLKRCLRGCGLVVLHERDISKEVLQARSREEQRLQALIRTQVPRGLRGAFREIAGLPGTTVYRSLQQGAIVYWSCLLRKPGGASDAVASDEPRLGIG